MKCAESLRVQAYFDAEVDALSAAEIERHTAHCTECRALLEDLERARRALRGELPFEHAPRNLRASIARLLERETAAAAVRMPSPGRRARPYWLGALGGAAAAAALAAWVAFLPAAGSPLLDDLVTAHVRSLMPQHLTDVVSTDRHTVKPWFAGHANVSPVVADFASQGYRLLGGRADYFEHQRVAAIVYQHGLHLINVFAWAGHARGAPAFATRDGYHIACWTSGDLQYCAVSDTGREELIGLERLLEELAARDRGDASAGRE